MTDKIYLNPEERENNSFKTTSKLDHDLYHEEDDVVMPVIRIKHISKPASGEKWKIMENNKIIWVVEGAKLSKKEKEFLRTIDGTLFLIRQYKNGIKSFHALRTAIKNNLEK